MDSGEFLEKLLSKFDSDNVDITNIQFKDINNYFLKLLDSFTEDKKIVCISLSYFNKNLEIFSCLRNIHYLESIISLPIYNNDDNLLILIFNSQKKNDKCLFIDESDSLVHKSDSVDWTYAYEELVNKITKIYEGFLETDSSVILDIDDIFSSVEIQNNSDNLISFESEVIDDSLKKDSNFSEELLSLKSEVVETSPRKHRVISDDVADGLLSLKQHQSITEEITKHDLKAVEIPQSNTLPFLNDAMYYKKRQNPENLLHKEGKRLIEGEVKFKKLQKITDLHNIYVKNDKDSVLIGTCKTCNSKLVYYNHEIHDFKGEVFIELINVSDEVSIDYLYEYLNSDNGLADLMYYSKGNSHITPEGIKNLKIPIPTLEVQKEIVQVSRESREFFKSIELLKKEFNSNILDYKHMKNSLNEFKGNIEFNSSNEITELSRNWRHTYKGLIWPLAISYLLATKGGFEIVEKKDNYLVLFEFIAAFNSIVLLSGLPDDVYQKNFSKIWNSKNPFEYTQMTFANWVYLSKNLADVYKFNNFTSQLDENLFDKIADDVLLDILEKVKNIRNNQSHGSQSNAYEAEKIIEKLDYYLEDIFDILEVYSNYKLVYVTGQFESVNQGYEHRIILLNGPCAQPIYDNIICDSPLQRESLYLYNPKNNKKLLLKDSFIKFMSTDENKKHWALFIYYSCDRNENNAFYKCFQSDEKQVKDSIFSLELDILGKSDIMKWR